MTTQLFLNLAVKDLNRSVDFFTQLGFSFNPQFTNEKAACMVIEDNIFVMLLVESFFQSFTDKQLCDPHTTAEALICLSRDSNQAVDDMVAKALAAGGKAPRPADDHGFMYSHGFEDLDGHNWELVHMVAMPDQASQ